MRPAILAVVSMVAVAAGAAGCGDDGECGPGDAAADGLAINTGDSELVFGAATSSPNNDCPADGAPTSLTVEMRQVDPAPATPRFFVLCLPRPDQLDGAIDLADESRVQVIDVFADENDCLISLDRARAISGTATFSGVCDDGTNAAGYALGLVASIPATRSCAGVDEAIVLEVTGTLAVTSLQP